MLHPFFSLRFLASLVLFAMYSLRYYIDSWIELSSQPSSSSLSSAATTDDIVTTGLRIQQQRRRRGPRHILPRDIDISYPHRSSSFTESSQDENEEPESESDQILSSSNEDLPTRADVPRLPNIHSPSDEALSSDEDDTSTALGFNPQPNAFSHPPASQRNMLSRPNSLLQSNRPNSRRNSRAGAQSIRRSQNPQQHQQQQQHSPYNMISPSHHADHDAALRASLSTLLSCAAAARRLPKNDSPPAETSTGNRADPSSFRLVPESMATENEGEDARPPTRQLRPSPPVLRKRSPSPINTANKARRNANISKERTINQQPSDKRSRRTTATDINGVSPTVMTWVISAGVVVLFSAISFSAGYVLGREIGRLESSQGMYGAGISDPGTSGCGKEAVKGGLGRFRWVGGGMGSGISA